MRNIREKDYPQISGLCDSSANGISNLGKKCRGFITIRFRGMECMGNYMAL